MKNSKEQTIESSFKVLCKLWIEKYDYLQYAKLFAPYKDYNTERLKEIYANNDNQYLIEKAKNTIKEYSHERFNVGNDPLFFDTTGIALFIDGEQNEEQRQSKTTVKIRLYYLCFVAFVLAIYASSIDYDENVELDLEKLKNNSSNNKLFYRGQHNYEWRISPSILRGLNKSMILNDDSYFNFLKDDKSEEKFNKLIRTKGTNTYDKYAFMQHSRSFSPFIDFTKDVTIATSFALSNVSSVNDFRNNDSSLISIYCLPLYNCLINDKGEAKKFLKNEFKMTIIDSDYFIFGKTYKVENAKGGFETVCIKSFLEFVHQVTPKFKIFDIATNDRMKYQKGVFVCFYDCLCFKSFICYELNFNLQIRKYRIDKTTKRDTLQKIYDIRSYDPEHLMDPYLVFKE